MNPPIRSFLKTLLFLFSGVLCYGQPAELSGIFLNAGAFTEQKLTDATDCATGKLKIKFNDFLGRPYIDVIHDGKAERYQKQAIFGFRMCDGKQYRFVGIDHYLILNPGEQILLYEVDQPAVAKVPAKTLFFFSKDAAAPVLPLTIVNLKGEFPENHKFHDALDITIRRPRDLAAYDTFYKKYKINHLLDDSLK